MAKPETNQPDTLGDAPLGAQRERKFRLSVAVLYERTGGQAWEPRIHTNEFIEWMLREGYVRRVDGRCGFEAFKDSMLAWTDAARAALATADGPTANPTEGK